jgi:hypothetical protein
MPEAPVIRAEYTSRTPGRRGHCILYGGAKYLQVLSMEFGSCDPSCAADFELASRFQANYVINTTNLMHTSLPITLY